MTVTRHFNPSDVMPVVFTSRVDSIKEKVEEAHQEAELRRRERKEDDNESESSDEAYDAEMEITEDLEHKIFLLKRDYATIGPDGTGMDEIIKVLPI